MTPTIPLSMAGHVGKCFAAISRGRSAGMCGLRLLLRDRYESLALIPRVKTPMLIIAGERDSVVPAEFSRRLFDAAPQPKTFVSIPGADHNDDELLDGKMVIEAIAKFLDANE